MATRLTSCRHWRGGDFFCRPPRRVPIVPALPIFTRFFPTLLSAALPTRRRRVRTNCCAKKSANLARPTQVVSCLDPFYRFSEFSLQEQLYVCILRNIC